ncbi:hypothetical protein H0H92_005756 [Tricholoma furcatifolium]|nr:hypothetical protein H0H92_005756 [Tricholoma furcatifolium]
MFSSKGYANGVIGSVNTLLKRTYGADVVDAHNYSTVLSSLAFAGTVVGMLIFGYLSDKVGRKFGMMTATGIVAVFSALSAASSGAHGSIHGMLAMLSAMRFLLGIGIGAEYPCGSVSAAEQTEQPLISKRAQHRYFVLATNFVIDFGFVIAAFVPLVLFWIFGENHLRAVWRLSLGLGVVPALIVFVWRLNMEEPGRFKTDSMKRFGLYSSTIVNNLFYMPGVTVGAFAVDYLGPKWTMVVYGIFLSFGEFGPGSNLGLLASKSCPTGVRGQFYGMAAAIGKIGAFVGTWAFGGSSTARGNTGPFWVGSGLAILSALNTFFFINPLGHDGMQKEDIEFREYLEANGFDTSLMGLGEETAVEQEVTDEKVVSEDKV